MKKTLCLIVSLAILGISGCDVFLGPDVPVGIGTLSIGFGENGGARSVFDVSDDILATLRYDLVLTGPDRQKITAPLAVGQIFNEQVALGEWLIEAKAFAPDGALFGTGSTTITVRAGPNQVRVPMTKVSTEDTPVSALDLTALVAAPVRDTMPNAMAIDVAQYTGTVSWKKEDGTPVGGNFAPSTIYRAVINLTAKSGYTFDGVGANSFSYTGAAVTNPAGSGNAMTVTITFPVTAAHDEDTRVNVFALTALVIAPVKDVAPVTTAIDAGQYTGTVSWKKEDGTPVGGNFAPSTVYKAIVTLTAKAEFTFTGVDANSFSYTGAAATNPAGSGNTLTVTITFPATGVTQYIITFDSHDGSTVQVITANEGTAVNKPVDPAREGYTFLGWFDAATGEVLYSWPHTLTANVTMHARWQDKSLPPSTQYTITFDSHSGSAIPPVTANENMTVSKPANPTKAGYTFLGWFNATTGGTEYTVWPHTLAANVTMHARWAAISYNINYVLNEGTHSGNPASYTIESASITLAAATRGSYTFGGWYDNSGFTGSAVTSIPQGSTGNKTFYAKWTAVSYTITYELYGGTNGANPAAYTIESANITLAAATRGGYTFGGWYGTSDFSDSPVAGIPQGSTGNKTYYAKWTAVSYTITYELYGGTNGANPAAYTIESAAIPLTDATRGSYTFGGWYDNGSFSGNKITSIPAGSMGNKTLYAKWYPSASVQITLQPEVDPSLSNAPIFEDDPALFSAGTGYESWQWYWDGTPIIGEDTSTYTLTAYSKTPGIYELSVVVTTDGGATLSARCRITVKAR